VGDFTCINAFEAMGRAKIGGMSLVPLDPQHIESWMRITGRYLNGWECETVLMLSDAYCHQARISTEENCASPYQPEIDPREHAKQMRKKLLANDIKKPTAKR